ncbi:MAG: rRNA pseudouridine synthase [Deltaproteobacteria bacterium]|nr:rRNA pseudouridine synthase [Deltaproteobacteria bacterium]
MEERLQKFLARAGIASRRKAETLIAEGRVTVNGQVVREQGLRVDGDRDVVTVDGKAAFAREEQRYFLLYKPPGCVTTLSDPQGRRTAAEYLRDVKERVFPVGRLDYDAEGAVLFTTDGELAHRLAHPRYGHRRVYLVKVKGGDEERLAAGLARMVAGVRLEDGPAKALSAVVHEEAEKNVWVRVEVGEGRFHLVKRLCEAVGLQVLRLFRPEFGGASVQGLRPGQYRPLTAEELRGARRAVGLEGGEAAPQKPSRPPSELPRAARRHGHGPPAPPGAEPAPAPRPAPRAAARPQARSAGERGTGPRRPRQGRGKGR